jgi:hypothetical protein
MVVDEVSFELVSYWPIAVNAFSGVWAPDAKEVMRGHSRHTAIIGLASKRAAQVG